MSDLSFADPWLLWILGPLYLLWVAAWALLPVWRRRQGRAAAVRYSSLATVRKLRPSWTVRGRRFVEAARLLAVALVLLAMARPQTGRKLTEVSSEGIDIVLVLDTSGSMHRENDQMGLVVFGEEAFTQCPLTLDHGILTGFLEDLEIGVAGDRTAIGSAVGTAVKRLRDSAAESKVIILLTDGRNNAGTLSPQQAADIAATYGVKIYAIGAGTRGKAPFLVDSLFGQRVVHQDVEIDDEQLRAVAEATGGAYYRAVDSQALRGIYEEIDELERTEITTDSYMEYDERFAWLVVPAIALLLFEVTLLGTRFRKLP
jgi:Ca-activated chloride channel family protein